MSSARLRRFVLVSRPTGADWWKFFLGSRDALPALGNTSLVGNRLALVARGGGTVLWPAVKTAHTFAVRHCPPSGVNRGSLVVQPAALGWLNGCPSNRLYLPGVPDCDLLALTDTANNQHYYFRPGPALAYGSEAPLAAAGSPLANAFFHQVRDTDLTADEVVPSREDTFPDSRVEAYELDTASDVVSGDGWFNPVLLLVDLSGTGLAAPVGDGPTDRHVFAHLSEAGAVLHVEPLWDETWTGRHWFQKALFARWRNTGSTTPSAVERLYWGANPLAGSPHPWIPFFALDGLGGEFLLSDHGTAPRYEWRAAEDVEPNRVWFARYWHARWDTAPEGDTEGADPTQAPPADVRQVIPPPPPAREWRTPTRRVACDPDEIDELLATAPRLLARAGRAATGTGPEALLGWLAEVIAADPLPAAVDCHQGYYRLRPGVHGGGWAVAIDTAGFLQSFADSFLAPRSPVRVELPEQNWAAGSDSGRAVRVGPGEVQRAWLVDLTRSLQDGSRELLTRWFRSAVVPRKAAVEVPFEYGWWNDWYDRLYTSAWNVRIRFVLPAAGFVLGTSRLAQGELGAGRAAYQQDPFIRLRF